MSKNVAALEPAGRPVMELPADDRVRELRYPPPRMVHFFRAGPELVRWELTLVEQGGPYRLALHHAKGVIIEYFDTSAAALVRIHELEQLLVRARGFMEPEQVSTPC